MINDTTATDPVEILMEGAMFGSQVDSVLMEGGGGSNRDRRNDLARLNKFKAGDNLSPANRKKAAASAKFIDNLITKAQKQPKGQTLPKGATKEDISKATKVATDNVNTTATTVVTGKVKSIKETVAIVKDEIKVEKDPVKKKALEKVVNDAEKQIKFIERAQAAGKTFYDKISKLVNTLVLNNINVTGYEKQGIRVALIVVTYSVMYGIAKTIPGIKLGSFGSIKSNLQSMLTIIKGNTSLVAKQYVIWVLHMGAVMNIMTMGPDLIKLITATIKSKFGSK